MYSSSARIVAMLLLSQLAIACSHDPAVIVIEGEISPELTIAGETWFRVSKDLIICKRYLLQNPQPKGWDTKGKVVHRGDRYALRFDLQDAPWGGICGWRLMSVSLEAHLRARPPSQGSLGSLSNVQNLPVHLQAEEPRLPPNATLRCHFFPDMNSLHCETTQRGIDTNRKEVHVTLNVKYEKGDRASYD